MRDRVARLISMRCCRRSVKLVSAGPYRGVGPLIVEWAPYRGAGPLIVERVSYRGAVLLGRSPRNRGAGLLARSPRKFPSTLLI